MQAIKEAMSQYLDMELLGLFERNLKYHSDAKIVNMPNGTRYYASEFTDDDCFVWAGFVPPGHHKIEVEDPLNKTIQDSFLAGTRQDDIHPKFSLNGADEDQSKLADDLILNPFEAAILKTENS